MNRTTVVSPRNHWAQTVKSGTSQSFKTTQLSNAKNSARQQMSQLALAQKLLKKDGVFAIQIVEVGQPRPDLNEASVLRRAKKGGLKGLLSKAPKIRKAPTATGMGNKKKVAPDTASDRGDTRSFRLDDAYMEVENGLEDGALKLAVQKELAALKLAADNGDRGAYVGRLEDLMDAVEGWSKSDANKTLIAVATAMKSTAKRQEGQLSSATTKVPTPVVSKRRSSPEKAKAAFEHAALEATFLEGDSNDVATELATLYRQLKPYLDHLDANVVSTVKQAAEDGNWQVFATTMFKVAEAM